jgi:hypothetical protein
MEHFEDNAEEVFETRKERLREVRNRLLRFHKVLMDREREVYESRAGVLTSGQFLNLLMTDERFEWLRAISKLIVKIDESFDLDDGLPPELLDKYIAETRLLFDESESNKTFKLKMDAGLSGLPEGVLLRNEIVTLLK